MCALQSNFNSCRSFFFCAQLTNTYLVYWSDEKSYLDPEKEPKGCINLKRVGFCIGSDAQKPFVIRINSLHFVLTPDLAQTLFYAPILLPLNPKLDIVTMKTEQAERQRDGKNPTLDHHHRYHYHHYHRYYPPPPLLPPPSCYYSQVRSATATHTILILFFDADCQNKQRFCDCLRFRGSAETLTPNLPNEGWVTVLHTAVHLHEHPC